MRPCWLVPLCLGCGAEAEWLPLPPLEGASGFVLATSVEGTITEAQLFRADESPRVAIAANDPSVEIFAALYTEPIESIGLHPGTLVLDPNGKQLHPPTSVLAADRAASRWEPMTERNPFDSVRVHHESRCERFQARPSLELAAGDSDVSFGFQLSDGSAFLATAAIEAYHAYRYTLDGQVYPVTTNQLPIHSAFRADEGSLWLGGRAAVHRVRIMGPGLADESQSNQLEVLESFPFTPNERFTRDAVFSVVVRTNPLEIFGLTGLGHFLRFDGSAWSVLFDFAWQEPLWASGGVVDLGPDGVIAAWSGSSQIARFKDGELSFEGPAALMDGFTGVGFVPAVGALAGTSKGAIYRRVGHEWEPMGPAGLSLNVLTFAPFGPGGFLVGSSLSVFAEYRPEEAQFCPVVTTEVFGANVILPLDERTLLVSGALGPGADRQPPKLVILDH
ncbi:MAG: hypothetical protein HY791_09285 [Deltaproteobacteria bacterium]|nr:hypothetical protein [Deltaproteobacteria bacterium]